MNIGDLKKPFPANDIEWRIQQATIWNGKPRALVLAYITNRAVQNRLDEVCGPGNWKDDFSITENGVICKLSIKIDNEWISKSDGAPFTNIEAFKGGISDSEKRAAVKWGIGRYLYDLPKTYAVFTGDGEYSTKIKIDGKDQWFKWNPPALPEWALPKKEDTTKIISDPNYSDHQNKELF